MNSTNSPRFLRNPIWAMLSFALLFSFVESRSELGMIGRNQSPKRTVYDVLTANGLPVGLLPEGVDEFKIDESGRFSVRLDQPCNAKFESELHYERDISGILSFGKISNFSGVQAQELFLWFPVKTIHVDVPSSGLIYFDVGVVFKQFSLSLFETPPDCVAVAPNDPQLVSVSKRKNAILQRQLPREEFGNADI